jgi:hypothetical protein
MVRSRKYQLVCLTSQAFSTLIQNAFVISREVAVRLGPTRAGAWLVRLAKRPGRARPLRTIPTPFGIRFQFVPTPFATFSSSSASSHLTTTYPAFKIDKAGTICGRRTVM